MKWITQITGVAENILKMFRQVDRLFQKINIELYTAKITYRNGIYEVKVFDREGNTVDGAIVALYISSKDGNSTSGSLNWASVSATGIDRRTLFHNYTSYDNIIARIGKNGAKVVLSNPRATLKACVLGKEVSAS